MRNITVSLDDETYIRARVAAAARDTSVSALVKAFLEQLAAQETENRAPEAPGARDQEPDRLLQRLRQAVP